MTNPAQAIRSLVTYAVCIPLAIMMGYIMTEVGDHPDYSNLFVIGVVLVLLLSPIFIKWHYHPDFLPGLPSLLLLPAGQPARGADFCVVKPGHRHP